MIVDRVVARMHLKIVQEISFKVLQEMSHDSVTNLGLWSKIRKMIYSIVAQKIMLYAVPIWCIDKVVLANRLLIMQQTLLLYLTKCYSPI